MNMGPHKSEYASFCEILLFSPPSRLIICLGCCFEWVCLPFARTTESFLSFLNSSSPIHSDTRHQKRDISFLDTCVKTTLPTRSYISSYRNNVAFRTFSTAVMVPQELQNCNYLDSILVGVPTHDMTACAHGAYHPSQQSDCFAKSTMHGPKDFVDRKCRRSQNSLEQIGRTVFVSGLGHDVTEEILTTTFLPCGEVADCRVCASPSSSMRNGYLEFKTEISARFALSYSGIYLGKNTIRVVPSKTAIIPIDERFLPRSNEERARVARTIYVSNIDIVVYSDFLRCFFESRCGPVNKIRVLSDSKNRRTKIAFLEFSMEMSAQTALKCSGIMLGNLSIRVSPSKTPLHASGDSGKSKLPPSTKNQFLDSSPAIAGKQSDFCSDRDANLKYWMTLELLRSELSRMIDDNNQGISTPLSGALNAIVDVPSVLSRQMSSESDIPLEYRNMVDVSDVSAGSSQTATTHASFFQ